MRRRPAPVRSDAQRSPASEPLRRKKTSVPPSGEIAGSESPSEPSGGVVTAFAIPPAAGTSAIWDGAPSDFATSAIDCPSRVQQSDEDCCASENPLNSASLRPVPPVDGITLYSTAPPSTRANAIAEPSGD